MTGLFISTSTTQLMIYLPLILYFGTVLEPLMGSQLFRVYMLSVSVAANVLLLLFAYLFSVVSWTSEVLFVVPVSFTNIILSSSANLSGSLPLLSSIPILLQYFYGNASIFQIKGLKWFKYSVRSSLCNI